MPAEKRADEKGAGDRTRLARVGRAGPGYSRRVPARV